MPLIRPVGAALAALAPAAAAAAPFFFVDVQSQEVLGTFEAPAGGGPVTAFSVEIGGGVFDVLGAGPQAPVYDAAANDLGSAAGQVVFNSNTFPATTADDEAVTCDPGDCPLEIFDAFDDVPGEWAVQFLPSDDPAAAANLSTGFYEVAPIPLPAAGLLLLGALGALAVRGRASRG